MSSGTPPSKTPRSARDAAGAAGAPLPAGRLRSDYTRPPSAGSGRTPGRGAKDVAPPASVSAAAAAAAAAASIGAGYEPPLTHTNALYGAASVEDPAAAAAAAAALAAQLGPATAPGVRTAPLSAAAPALVKKMGAPSPALAAQGDLWAPPDQGDLADDVALDVAAPSAPVVGGSSAAGTGAAATPAPPQSAPLVLPAWTRARPFAAALSLAGGAARAGLDAEAEGEPAADLRSLPEAAREAALVDDLLYTFMGVPGRAVRPALVDGARCVLGPALAFGAAASLDERSAELVRRLLPLPEYAAVIERFAATRDRYALCSFVCGDTACQPTPFALPDLCSLSHIPRSCPPPTHTHTRSQPRARHGRRGARRRAARAAREVAPARRAARAPRALARRPLPQRAALPVPGADGVAAPRRRGRGRGGVARAHVGGAAQPAARAPRRARRRRRGARARRAAARGGRGTVL